MKKLLLAVALVASTVTNAEVNSSRWTVNDVGFPLVIEDKNGFQLAGYETCKNFGFLTIFDGDVTYEPNKVYGEIKIRVDRMTIHTFTDVEINKSESMGIKYHIPTSVQMRNEMEAGTTMRVQYNGNLVETYSLIGFTRAINAVPELDWCREGQDYFQDSNGTDYFKS